MRVRRLLVAAAVTVCLLMLGPAVPWAVSTVAGPGQPPRPFPPSAAAAQAPQPEVSRSRVPSPQAGPVPVAVESPGFWSWAVLDRATGQIAGRQGRTGTNTTESMIKAWIVADHLRRYVERGEQPPRRVRELGRAAIRHSDDAAAQTLYVEGGGDQVIQRLIDFCGLTGTTIYPGWWSRTEMTARDAVRMGLCLADGRAAGPEWTGWVLAQMRQVRGTVDPADQPHGGRWGIIDALPAALAGQVAIKNGWTAIAADRSWHVNCLAIAPEWILAVQARYPVGLGLAHGAGVCRDVARQVLTRFGIPDRG